MGDESGRVLEITPWPHQLAGARWLAARGRAILADEQGTGKTVTALLAAQRRGYLRGIIVCNNRKRQDWAEHVWATLGDGWHIPEPSEIPNWHGKRWLIVNYQYIHRWMPQLVRLGMRMRNRKMDSRRGGLCLIADEAHAAKNRKTDTCKSLRRVCVQAQSVFLLTATPMLNSPQDVWPLLSMIDPTRYRSFWRFIHQFFHVETDFGGRRKIGGLAAPDAFHAELKPHMLVRRRGGRQRTRRRKVSHHMTGAQLEAYRTELALRSEVKREPGLRLAWMTRLRQIAVDPRLCDPGYSGPSKLDTLRQVLAERETPTIVFCRQAETVRLICDTLSGAVPLHGGMTPTAQGEALRGFTDGDWPTLVATHGTAGEGLNLTIADRAIWMDLAWHPGGNQHALFRVDRPGQSSDNVEAIVIHTEDSIEDHIWDIVASKVAVTTGLLIEALLREET